MAALFTAAWSILDGDCAQAVAGGADSALHPVTLCELRRAGALAAGLKPGEGAAVIAIAVTAGDAGDAGGAELVACGVVPGAEAAGTFDARSLLCAVDPAALEPALSCVLTSEVAAGVDAVVTSGAVLPLRQLLQEQVRRHLPAARHFDMTDLEDGATETLAAAPALAWCAALKQLQAGAAAKLLVLSAGIDGDLGVVGLKRSR